MSTAPFPEDTTSSAQERSHTRLEGFGVALLILVMMALPAAEAVARRVFDTGIPGSAVVVQHLTLWIGFLGALLATATGNHLALSTQGVLPAGWPRRSAAILTRSVSAAVCALLAYASIGLVRADSMTPRHILPGVPLWWSELVMPVACAFMAFRFAWRSGPGPQPLLDRAVAFAAIGASFLLSTVTPTAGVVWALGVLVFVAFLAGAPVFVAMAGIAMTLFFGEDVPIAAVPTETLRLSTNATLPAVPLLTVAGYILAEGGTARRLVRAYKGLFGWMPGGIAVMAAFVCAVFTTFTGASGVTILALGGLILPTLIEEKYPEGFSLGLVTAAGSLGLLFPPSLPVILYGVVADTPIDQLFIGGLVPGLLMILLVAAYGVFVGIRAGAPRQSFHPREALAAIWDAKWDLGLPTIVIVAVATGWATVVEASALGAAYALLVEMLVFREVHPTRDLPRILVHAAALVGSVLILLGAALGLTSWFVDAEIPTRLVEWMTEHVKSPALFLLALNVVLLVLGSVLEIYSAIVVLAPLVAPLGVAYGIDPIHLGVVFLANLELGFLFPPMGLNLFLAASRFNKPLPYLYRRALPFLLIMAVGVLLITYVPAMTIGVVHAVRGTGGAETSESVPAGDRPAP